MRITIVADEKNVDDLVRKIYGKLSPADAVTAKEGLLNANPCLAYRWPAADC